MLYNSFYRHYITIKVILPKTEDFTIKDISLKNQCTFEFLFNIKSEFIKMKVLIGL